MVQLPERRSLRAFAWRARWAIFALFAAVLVRIALPGITSALAGGDLAVVLARDVKAGAELAPADLRLEPVPTDLSPDGALTSLDAALDDSPRLDLPAGSVLTESLLAGANPLDGVATGRVAVAVRLSDPGSAEMISAGDRIDVMASAGASGSGSIAPAECLAHSALVLRAPVSSDQGNAKGSELGAALGASDQAGLLLVEVTPAEAALIGGATAWAVISAVMVPRE
jgi:Flp pilus assembly protein CpaB